MAVKEAKVTMIGAIGSGKTTYLLGMYSVLSAGFQGYSIVTKHLDDDEEMSEEWDELCDHGTVPEPNDDQPKMYSFIFRQKGQTLLTFDWEDYRGGAMKDKETDPQMKDVASLHSRLRESDAIYLVLNGAHLTGATANPAKETLARRMNGMLNHTLDEREQRGVAPPSLVVMITKADMIRRVYPHESPATLLDMACDSARDLLGDCFNPGLHTLVCPVQIGDFGEDNADRTHKIDTTKVATRNLPYPMIHSFLNHLDSYTRGEHKDADNLEGGIAQSARDLAAFENSLRGIFQPRKVASARMQMQDEERRLRELREALARSDSQVGRLAADLHQAMIDHRVAVFEDGERLG